MNEKVVATLEARLVNLKVRTPGEFRGQFSRREIGNDG
jgi:hypothetical protein